MSAVKLIIMCEIICGTKLLVDILTRINDQNLIQMPILIRKTAFSFLLLYSVISGPISGNREHGTVMREKWENRDLGRKFRKQASG